MTGASLDRELALGRSDAGVQRRPLHLARRVTITVNVRR
jgi:hypothetical protein